MSRVVVSSSFDRFSLKLKWLLTLSGRACSPSIHIFIELRLQKALIQFDFPFVGYSQLGATRFVGYVPSHMKCNNCFDLLKPTWCISTLSYLIIKRNCIKEISNQQRQHLYKFQYIIIKVTELNWHFSC